MGNAFFNGGQAAIENRNKNGQIYVLVIQNCFFFFMKIKSNYFFSKK